MATENQEVPTSDPIFKRIESEMSKLLETVGRSRAVLLLTIDGHVLFDRPRGHEVPVEPVGAIASSLIGLSESLPEHLRDGAFEDLLVRTEQGMLALFKLHDVDDSLLLGVSVERKANLGLLLSLGAKAAENIRDILEQDGTA